MTNTSVGCKWATTQYIDDYSVKINNQCVNYSSICRNFEIAAKIADFLHKCLFRLPNYIAAAFRLHQIGWFPTVWGNVKRLPCKGWFPTVWGNVKRLPCKGSWLWATRTDWGIKRYCAFYSNSICSQEIPPACLRQPTSLYKGGNGEDDWGIV